MAAPFGGRQPCRARFHTGAGAFDRSASRTWFSAAEDRSDIDEVETGGPGEALHTRLRLRVFDTGLAAPAAPTLLARVCLVAVEELDLTGAAVVMVSQGGSGQVGHDAIASVSNDGARSLQQLELELGEGPSRSAQTRGRPVLTPDLAQIDGRWPGYAPAAMALGIRSVFVFPLHVGAVHFGVLALHRARTGSLANDEVARSLALTDLAVEIMLDNQLPGAVSSQQSDFLDDLELVDAIYQAQGMVKAALAVDLAEALAILRARAYADGRRLRDLADDVVAGRVRLPEHFQDRG